MSKSVRFNLVHTVVITYSAEEYDRSCFASVIPLSYTFRPALPMPTPIIYEQKSRLPSRRPAIKPLDLSIIPNSRRRALESPTTPTVEDSAAFSKKITNKKPRLSINTHSLTPLFFSGLSTHYKCKDDEEEEHGFLVPIMAC